MGLPGEAVYLVASTLAHAAVVFLAIVVQKPIESMFGHNDNADFAILGITAGGLDSALLGAATAVLIRCTRWPFLIVAGACLGALLPSISLEALCGMFLFYVIWQAGYAATFAAILQQARQTSGNAIS